MLLFVFHFMSLTPILIGLFISVEFEKCAKHRYDFRSQKIYSSSEEKQLLPSLLLSHFHLFSISPLSASLSFPSPPVGNHQFFKICYLSFFYFFVQMGRHMHTFLYPLLWYRKVANYRYSCTSITTDQCVLEIFPYHS